MKVLLLLVLVVGVTVATVEQDGGNLHRLHADVQLSSPAVDASRAVDDDDAVDERLVVVVNSFFDSIVDILRQFAVDNGLDPMELPDIKDGFKIGLLLLAIRGEITMTHGLLKDFSTLRRDGDAVVEYRKKRVDAHFVIGFDDLIMTYDYKAKLLHIGPKGGIIGTIKDMTMQIDISLDTETNVATLVDLQITHTGRLDLKFTGTILVDLVLNTLSDVVTLLFKGVIMNAIERNVRDAINDALNHDRVNSDVFKMLTK